jgi:hypothetical protein
LFSRSNFIWYCGVFCLLFLVWYLTGGLRETVQLTPTPVSDVQAMRRDAQYLDPRLLVSDPSGHVGENLLLQGKAANVEQLGEYTWISVLPETRQNSVADAIIVELRPPDRALLSDECYRFYGVAAGTTTVVQTLNGTERNAPLVNGYAYEPAAQDGVLGCARP